MFKKYFDVCFRDTYSYNLFKGIKSVRYSPDLLLSVKLPNIAQISGKIFVSVINPYLADCDCNNAEAENYISLMAKTVTLMLRQGHNVCLSGLCILMEDFATVNKIISQIPDNLKTNLKTINYMGDGNFQPVLSQIAQSEYCLAGRLHAMLFGFIGDKKTLPISYNIKFDRILNDIGFNKRILHIKQLENISPEDLLNKLLSQKPANIKSLCKIADRQFAALDKYIAKNNGTIIKYKNKKQD